MLPSGDVLVFLPSSDVGEVLALGQAVDAVVEQDDLHADVAAHGMNEVVTADGQRIAVARDHPYRQLPGESP